MKTISLPKKFITEDKVKGKTARITIEPCFPGYGLTLGNALRRVLLSSLPGGAVTAVKIKGVKHEFSALENVADDILEIVLNLKKLRVRVFTEEPVVLKLVSQEIGPVTGGDIESSSDVEIVNRDLVITHLTEDKKELEMEITVAKGIGYVPVEEQGKNKGEIGLILVDSIFTPVLNVGLNIEATRVGQKTDYDKIILDIETDGTISPEEAVQKAAEILTNQFSWIMEGGRQEIEGVDIEAPVILPEKEVIAEVAPEAEGEVQAEGVAASEEAVEEKPKKRGRPRKTQE